MAPNAESASDTPRPRGPSALGLDWLVFFNAAALTGFGPFVANYLASQQWTEAQIGLVLTAGGIAGLLSQVPGGELLDSIRAKRLVVAAAIATVAVGALAIALRPIFSVVLAAVAVQGATAGFLGPGIVAISCGLVGHSGLADRLGRNQRFASTGSFAAAGLLGLIGFLLSSRAVFIVAAGLALPALVAVTRIRASEIEFGRSCCAPENYQGKRPPRIRRNLLCRDTRLIVFTASIVLFQLANASVGPLLGEVVAQTAGRRSPLVISALIVVPQIIAALLAPSVGRRAEMSGRRLLLLVGFGVLPIRAVLLAMTSDPALLIAVQVLDGGSAAALGVLTALTIADITEGTGRFNLAQGIVGTASGLGASVSTTLSGLIVENLGVASGFYAIAAVALVAVLILWTFMPETKPELAPREACLADDPPAA